MEIWAGVVQCESRSGAFLKQGQHLMTCTRQVTLQRAVSMAACACIPIMTCIWFMPAELAIALPHLSDVTGNVVKSSFALIAMLQ